ncbi:MAG: cdisaccharide synthetase [Synergistaceae bacterium]|nr:cdisaccharide synthetase [Synergistaceae bacterium]
MKIALLTNGPGELWGWVRPVIAELRGRGHSVSLWLLPCQFASGYERAVASGLGADKLEGPCGSAWTWRALAKEKTDCVIQLGGDLLFGRRIAERAEAPLLCYAYGYKKGMERARVFTAYQSMAESIGAKLKTPAHVIGDLVKDSLSLEKGKKITGASEKSGEPHVLLFPGSRPDIRNLSIKWLTKVARHMETLIRGVRFTTLFSPFAPENEFPLWESAGLNPVKSGIAVSAAAVMKNSDYALTQPGTNTLELMHCGLPALVALPFDFLDAAPIGGLGRLVSGIPLAGRALKEWKLRRSLEQFGGFLSWPNRIAGRALLDEAVGKLTAYDLAERVAASLDDEKKLSRVRGELLELSGESDKSGGKGAASLLCDAAENAVSGQNLH